MITNIFKSFTYKGNVLGKKIAKLAPSAANEILKKSLNIWVIFGDNLNCHWLIAK